MGASSGGNVCNLPISKLMLNEEDRRIAEAIVADTENGCESYNQALKRLFDEGMISSTTALKVSPNPDELKIALSGIDISAGGGGIV